MGQTRSTRTPTGHTRRRDRTVLARLAVSVLLVTAWLCLALSLEAAAAPRHVPLNFFGVVADGPLLGNPSVDLAAEMGTMQSAGVESIRVSLFWQDFQPYHSFSEVPAGRNRPWRSVGGVPTDFSSFDRVVIDAAMHGLRILPVVQGAPQWAAANTYYTSKPARPDTYAAFLKGMIGRYGPRGSLWQENPTLPRVPIREWQIWNEPELPGYWCSQASGSTCVTAADGSPVGWASDYVSLLRAARTAIRRADPGAKVVLAGFTNFSWQDLQTFYQAGGRGLYDIAAVHPYSGTASHVEKIVTLFRGVMRRYHESLRPLMVTETSFSAGLGEAVNNVTWNTTEQGQAQALDQTYSLLVRDRRRLGLLGVYWYTWMTGDVLHGNWSEYTGLRRLCWSGDVVSKPVLFTFERIALSDEGRRSASAATPTQCPYPPPA